MPSTYSPDLRIELIANGEQSGSWGTTTNSNLGTIIEDAISGLASVSVTSANQALTAYNGIADEARCSALALSTTTAANFAVYVPPVTKLYVVKNSSAYTATVYCSTVIGNTTAAGSGVAIPAGKSVLLRSDGVNIVEQLNHVVNNLSTSGDVAVGGTLTATSPAFSGVPTAPTASFGTSTTQIATTQFVQQAGLVGEIKMWSLASAPAGYLLCNGAAVSRSTYAALFAVVGTIFGAGDGSTTFNLPDFRDRMPVGAGTTYSANSQGGSKDAVVVSHTHTASVTDPGHDHIMHGKGGIPAFGGEWYLGRQAPNFSGGGAANFGGIGSIDPSVRTGDNSTNISVANSSTGVSGTNANLPPYLGIYFIIKT